MSKIFSEVLAANQPYAGNFGDKGSLPLPPGRQFAFYYDVKTGKLVEVADAMQAGRAA